MSTFCSRSILFMLSVYKCAYMSRAIAADAFHRPA